MEDTAPAWSRPRRFALKLGVLIIAAACKTYLPYALLGLWNRAFGGWASIFFCYAGSRNFISTYAPPATVELFRWSPSPIGILRHNGRRGIVLASPVTEDHFLDPANNAAFRRLRRRLKRIAWLVGAPMINLAGILPSTLRDDDILKVRDDRQTVVSAVAAATRQILQQRFGGQPVDIILLGGAGYVGTPVAAHLRSTASTVHIVDPKSGEISLPQSVRDRPCLLIDIARRGAIGEYIDQMWPGLVVLNETFPQPSRRHVQAMAARQVEVWHLSGLDGSIIPPLPFGYSDAIPCCAAHGVSQPPKVRIVRLDAATEGGAMPQSPSNCKAVEAA